MRGSSSLLLLLGVLLVSVLGDQIVHPTHSTPHATSAPTAKVVPKQTTNVKAAFVMLVDNSGKTLRLAERALQQLHHQYNKDYHYPLVVFIEKGFPDSHKATLEEAHSGNVTYAMVDMSVVHNVNPEDIPESIPGFERRTTSVGYKSMCRFFSGDVFKNPVLANYDFIWRIDSDAEYICPINYDLFGYMESAEITYGWTIYFYEEPRISSDTLWDATWKYIKAKGIKPANMGPITNYYGGYDRCHYWNNFEVLDLNFFRSPEYLDYFNFLDKEGGFYLYRWGDALVRTVALHMLLPAEKLHFFDDVGYKHQGRCIDPCGSDIECHRQIDPYSGFCGIHAKICTLEDHEDLKYLGLAAAVAAILLWFLVISKKRQAHRNSLYVLCQGIKFKLQRFVPSSSKTRNTYRDL